MQSMIALFVLTVLFHFVDTFIQSDTQHKQELSVAFDVKPWLALLWATREKTPLYNNKTNECHTLGKKKNKTKNFLLFIQANSENVKLECEQISLLPESHMPV